MNVKLGRFFLFFMVVADFTRTVSSYDSKCPALKIINGRSKYRWRGRSVRFSCMRGFQLVGAKYAICMNGKWDADVPICVKYGCRAPSTTHVNGQFIESYRGAVVKIVCNPGYTLIGSPSVYCNGVNWNETFPMCRVKDSNPALFCDFEDPNLCGWSQDPMHDFDWKRQNGSTPSGEAGTGPTFDHTRGENRTGYYMYLESSSPRMENDAARLYSPVYPPEYSNGTCFKFWYHMHGATTGFLKVYVKPEGAELSTLIPSFWINGEQGTFWIESFFHVEQMEIPFQIVIEGLRGTGAVGDTAFDDVKLTSADECKILEEMTSSTESSSSSFNPDDDTELLSCENRCNQELTNGTGAESDKCSCYDNCTLDLNCCYDYFSHCYTHDLFEDTSTTETDTTTSLSTSSPSTTPSEEMENEIPFSPSKPSPPTHSNDESNDILPVPLNPMHNRTLNEIPKLDHPRTVTETTTTSTPQPNIPTVRNAVLPKKKFAKSGKNKTKAATVPVVNESNEIPRKEVPTKSDGKTEGKTEGRTEGKVEEKIEGKTKNPNATDATSSVYTTTARAFKHSKPNNIKLTFLEKPSSPNLSNESRFNKGNSKEVPGKEPPQAIKIDKREQIIEMGLAGVAILVIIILGMVCYKRREHRKAERENMVEDSDSIVYEMDSSTLGSESHSLVCIRPGGLQRNL